MPPPSIPPPALRAPVDYSAPPPFHHYQQAPDQAAPPRLPPGPTQYPPHQESPVPKLPRPLESQYSSEYGNPYTSPPVQRPPPSVNAYFEAKSKEDPFYQQPPPMAPPRAESRPDVRAPGPQPQYNRPSPYPYEQKEYPLPPNIPHSASFNVGAHPYNSPAPQHQQHPQHLQHPQHPQHPQYPTHTSLERPSDPPRYPMPNNSHLPPADPRTSYAVSPPRCDPTGPISRYDAPVRYEPPAAYKNPIVPPKQFGHPEYPTPPPPEYAAHRHPTPVECSAPPKCQAAPPPSLPPQEPPKLFIADNCKRQGHEQYLCDIYCNVENKYVCLLCLRRDEHHKHHKCKASLPASANQKNSISEWIQHSKNQQYQLQDLLRQLDGTVEKLQESTEKEIEKLEETIVELHKKLDANKKDLIEKARRETEEETAKLSACRAEILKNSSKLEDAIVEVNKLSNNSTVAEVAHLKKFIVLSGLVQPEAKVHVRQIKFKAHQAMTSEKILDFGFAVDEVTLPAVPNEMNQKIGMEVGEVKGIDHALYV